MIYTVIYKDDSDMMGTFTFASQKHDRTHAWTEYTQKYATDGQSPVAIMPGNHIVYFPQDISFVSVA